MSLIFPPLYVIFHRTIMVEQRGLSSKMNGNTAELYGWPLEGGGGTVYPDSICALRNACADGMSAFAQSRAEQSRAEQSRAEQR